MAILDAVATKRLKEDVLINPSHRPSVSLAYAMSEDSPGGAALTIDELRYLHTLARYYEGNSVLKLLSPQEVIREQDAIAEIKRHSSVPMKSDSKQGGVNAVGGVISEIPLVGWWVIAFAALMGAVIFATSRNNASSSEIEIEKIRQEIEKLQSQMDELKKTCGR